MNKGHLSLFILENIKRWTKYEDEELGSHYNLFGQHRVNALQFQHFIVDSSFHELVEKCEMLGNRVMVTERSLLTNVFSFITPLYERGEIGRLDFLLLREKSLKHFDFILRTYALTPFFILLQDSPSNAMKRVLTRGREGEEGVDLAYLTELGKR